MLAVPIGYCTNVHAGADLPATLANLRTHAAAVKALVSPGVALPIGLWLSAETARELVEAERISELREELDILGLAAHSINGFPFGDFHAVVVKHEVYLPHWADRRRLAYTRDLATVLAAVLPEGGDGSISTLPLGWPGVGGAGDDAAFYETAATQLTTLAGELAELEAATGRYIHIDIEPEPGCLLDTATDVVRFFEDHLLRSGDDATLRRHIRVCHDVCHAAVMFEDQATELTRYRGAGIGVGKVQLSSAVRVGFDTMDEDQRGEALRELRAFAEPRYLHQTVMRGPGDARSWADDLPEALSRVKGGEEPRGEWRVHFHMPLHIERVGAIQTTQAQVIVCLQAIGPEDDVRHIEVETYAWGVLPEALRPANLAEGIAAELRWVRAVDSGPGR